jgi:hypothetical protein
MYGRSRRPPGPGACTDDARHRRPARRSHRPRPLRYRLGPRRRRRPWQTWQVPVAAQGSTHPEVSRPYVRGRRTHSEADSHVLWLGRTGRLTDSGIRQMVKRQSTDWNCSNRTHQLRHTMAHSFLAASGSEGSYAAGPGPIGATASNSPTASDEGYNPTARCTSLDAEGGQFAWLKAATHRPWLAKPKTP